MCRNAFGPAGPPTCTVVGTATALHARCGACAPCSGAFLGIAVDAVARASGAADPHRGGHQTRTRRPRRGRVDVRRPRWRIASVLDARRRMSMYSCPRAVAGSTRCAVRRGDAPITASRFAGSPTAAAVRSRCTTAFDVGDTLVFEGPRNAFYLGRHERDVLFVIGGIGVTPILPMIQVAASTRNQLARNLCRPQPRLHAVAGRGGVRGARPRHGVGRRRARPIRHRRRSAGRRRADDGCLRVRAHRHAGSRAGGPQRTRQCATALRAVQPAAGGRRNPFELELARSQRVLSVPANRSALGVMLDRDPTTAYSCQQGFCGTCKVKVLAGQVDRRGRTTEADGEMLVCVSRAKGDRVVIDA